MKNKTRTLSKAYIVTYSYDDNYTIHESIDGVIEHLESMSDDIEDFHKYAEQYIRVYELGRELKVTVPTPQITVE